MAEQNLSEALRAHQKSMEELSAQVDAALHSDTARENRTLQDKLDAAQAWRVEAERRVTALEQENRNLRGTLYDHLFNERTALVNSAQQRVRTYYSAQTAGELNRLTKLEQTMKQRADALRADLVRDQNPRMAAFVGELYDLENRAKSAIAEARAAYEPVAGAFTAEESAAFDALKKETLTPQQMNEVSKKNNLEVFIGQNLINKVGVLLIVIGVIAASQYTLLRLPDVFKGAAMFLLGALMLVGGELMNRRKPNVFSLGITAGGVAVLYAAMSVSYFVLHILGVYPAIAVCVLVTAASFLLALRYSSQTIATFAMIGGYLPLLAVGDNSAMLYGAMAYFVALNLLALLLSLRRRWLVCTYTGFALNLGASIFIAAGATRQLWAQALLANPELQPWAASVPFSAGLLLLLAYLVFTFLIYTAVPIAGALRAKQPLSASEFVLLALNTIVSSLILYSAFWRLGLSHMAGLLAITFAVIYLTLGRLLETRLAQDKRSCALFYLTGLAFVVLVVPFQFGRVWLSLGWLVEGLVLLIYGILKNDRFTKRVGSVICGLCLGAFLLFDVLPELFYQDGHLFPWKYLAITLGSVAVYVALRRVKAQDAVARVFSVCAAVNLWLYGLYLIFYPLAALLRGSDSLLPYFANSTGVIYLQTLLAAAITVLLAYLYTHLRALALPALHVLGMVMNFSTCAYLLVANVACGPRMLYSAGFSMYNPGLFGIQKPVLVWLAALVLANLVSVFAMREALMLLTLKKKMGLQYFPFFLSAYFLLLTTQVLLVDFRLAFSSIVISLLYMVAAVAWVVLGFVKRYAYLRRFGLGLALLSVVKLFLVDLFSLTDGYRIALYFALGVSLIAISFVYQYFSRKFEGKEEVKHE